MRTLLNIIWFFFGGLPLFLGYLLAGVVACIFIVTIPAGVACFRIAGYVLWPFGKRVVDQPGAGAGSALMNVVWFLVAGHRPRHHRRRAGHHDRRNSLGHRQPEDDPDHLLPLRQGRR